MCSHSRAELQHRASAATASQLTLQTHLKAGEDPRGFITQEEYSDGLCVGTRKKLHRRAFLLQVHFGQLCDRRGQLHLNDKV